MLHDSPTVSEAQSTCVREWRGKAVATDAFETLFQQREAHYGYMLIYGDALKK